MEQSVSNRELSGKHQCPDCKMCQGCSETRCRSCRSGGSCTATPRLSIKEQIALFNSLNPDLGK